MTDDAKPDMMMISASAEHRWLTALVGDWTYEASMVPADPFVGVETVRALGDLWILLEGATENPDGEPFRSQMTLGYDPDLGRFVGTFISSVQGHVWIYETGALDPDGKTLRLECDGPAFYGSGGTDRYMDVIDVVSETERRLSSNLRETDGSWRQFMTTTYRRKA